MTVERTATEEQARQQQQQALSAPKSISEILDALARFEGPPEKFLELLLAVQCSLAQAAGGAILRGGLQGPPSIIAVYPALPQGQTPPAWLATAVEAAPDAARDSRNAVLPLRDASELYGQPAQRHLLLLPLRGERGVRGLAAFVLNTGDRNFLRAAQERLELTLSLLGLYEMRLSLQQRQGDLMRLRMGMETLASLNEHEKFTSAAMAACNELATRLQCERTALGFLHGRCVKLRALSHTEKFSRKMQLVQNLEAAMEECIDQDLEIVHPAPPQATVIHRAAGELSKSSGGVTVLSVPLRRKGEPFAVLTLERPADRPWLPGEVEAVRLTGDLVAPRLHALNVHGRWFGARWAHSSHALLGAIVGPRHTWAKIAAVGALALILFLVFVQGDYRADASFVLQPQTERVVPVPYDGYLASVNVRPGDAVKAGDILATLDTSLLRDQIAEAQSKLAESRTRRSQAMAENKLAEARIAEHEAQATEYSIRTLQRQLGQAEITAPVDGYVTEGDWTREIDKNLQKGDILFKVSPLETLYAELALPEDQIADVDENDEGELATVGAPDHRIRFRIERINPVAEVVKDRNVFKVRARLIDVDPASMQNVVLRPGMEGVAKVDLGKASYGWLWTRKIVNWVRMKLWI